MWLPLDAEMTFLMMKLMGKLSDWKFLKSFDSIANSWLPQKDFRRLKIIFN